MITEPDENTRKNRFRVVSVEKTTPPAGMPDGNWHRYIIGQGSSKIEGKKPGSLKSVTEHAETVAEDLNMRATKGNSAYAARKRK
jgi:hypothetical protein